MSARNLLGLELKDKVSYWVPELKDKVSYWVPEFKSKVSTGESEFVITNILKIRFVSI